jgi:hypothetical protein
MKLELQYITFSAEGKSLIEGRPSVSLFSLFRKVWTYCIIKLIFSRILKYKLTRFSLQASPFISLTRSSALVAIL